MIGDLGMFDVDDLFDRVKPISSRTKETVNNRFRRLLSLSPLDIIIRTEDRDDLQNKAKVLKRLLRENLNFIQYAFLEGLLSGDWDRQRRMLPLEFKDFNNGGHLSINLINGDLFVDISDGNRSRKMSNLRGFVLFGFAGNSNSGSRQNGNFPPVDMFPRNK